MSQAPLLITADTTRAAASVRDHWPLVQRVGWIPLHEPLTVWRSTTCLSPEWDDVLTLLVECVGQQPTMLDARLESKRTIGSGVRVSSPLLNDGAPLPKLWLVPGRLLVLCELRWDRLWTLRGAMAAQAEPLQLAGAFPAFRAAQVACEAHRLGAADLVLMLATTSTGPRLLVSPSALLLDTFVAARVGLSVGRIAHLSCWQRRWRLPNVPAQVDGLEILPPRAAWSRAAVASQHAAAWTADIASDVRRAWANRYRVPGYIRRRRARSA